MKPLVFLNGPMGVGKSTVAALLQQKFDRCAYLDGDWCYRVQPFRVTNESKALVLHNIAYLLDGYLKSPDVDLVLFSWVMNKREIRDAVLSKMTERGKCLFVTLTASEEALTKRFEKDIAAGLRTQEGLSRALSYLPDYKADFGGLKLITDDKEPDELAEIVKAYISTHRED